MPTLRVKVEAGTVLLDAHELATHALDLQAPGPARSTRPPVPSVTRASTCRRRTAPDPHPLQRMTPPGHRNPLHLPLLRRRLRRRHRDATATQITGVRGDPDHPANFGRLCTKGATLHLTASAAVTRQTRLLQPHAARGARRGAAARVAWDDGARRRRRPLRRRSSREHGPDAVGLLHLRPAAHRGLLRLQQAGQGPDRHQQHRHQLAPVHVQRGGRLQADARRRRAAGLLRGHRPRATASSSPARNTAFAHPILFRRIEDAKAREPGAEDHRRRPAPHRDRARSPTCTCRSSPAPTSRSSTACCT